jgi:RHS repeat-associated protein
VNLSTGLFDDTTTDLTLHDVEGVVLSRTYRQLDNTVRDFGMGTSSSLNLYVVADSAGNFDLYGTDGGEIVYSPTSSTGLYRAVGSPTALVGSTLNCCSFDPYGPFTIHLKNGTVLSFGNPGYLTKATDRFGNAITIGRDAASGTGQISTVTTPDGLWMKFSYGSCVTASASTMCITRVQDNSGRTLTYAYDGFGRLTTITDPAGGTTRYTWAPCTSSMTCTELASIRDANANLSTNTYDPITGWVTAQTDGNGGKWTYTYQTGSSGRITQANVTDPRGIQNAYSFDANGFLTSVTNAAGTNEAAITTAVFDPSTNLLTSETDPLGRTTTLTYDAMGNMTSETLLAGTANPSVVSFTYEPVYNRIASTTNALGRTTSIAYNDSSHTRTISDPLGHSQVIELNNEGQQIRITDGLGKSTYLSYLYGDLVAIADPSGNTATIYYDSIGQPLEISDPERNTSSLTWTALGEKASQTTPLGNMTTYGYDSDGDLTALTDPNGNTTTFAYDGNRRLTTKTDPLGNISTNGYDQDGNLTSVTDANGNKNRFTFDTLNRLVTAKYGVTSAGVQSTVTSSYDSDNRLVQAVDSVTGTYTLTYDGLDDVLSAGSPQGTIAHTYNADGLATSMTVPGQATVTYTYDKGNHLTRIAQGTSRVKMAYDADYRQTSLTLPDGVRRKTTYNATSDPASLTFTKGSTQIGALTYGYGADGEVTSVAGSLASSNLPPAVTANVYNADNELTSANGVAYSYDNSGELTSDGPNIYTWNTRRQLVFISGGVNASFTYDPFGRRATATVNGTATNYLYDGLVPDSTVVQEQSGGNPTENLLSAASGQIFQLTTPTGTNSSFLTDRLGSTVALANTSGQITTKYSYDPDGEVTSSGASSRNAFEFDATQNDGSGLYQMGSRYYSPKLGRFISKDPVGFSGGTTNLYSYALNDPVDLADPTGLCFCDGLLAFIDSLNSDIALLTALSPLGVSPPDQPRIYPPLEITTPILIEYLQALANAWNEFNALCTDFGDDPNPFIPPPLPPIPYPGVY